MKALIVDDSLVGRRAMLGVLQHYCECDENVQAADGEEAVKIASDEPFDLIVKDWNMPKMLGIDALRAIRALDTKTPIVMVTGEKERERVVEGFDAGASDYIVKPYSPQQAAEKIHKVMLHAQDRRRAKKAEKALVADDSGVIRRLLTGMLTERCGVKEVEEAADGAVALQAALANKYDLILLDWNMPEMNGIDVVRAIRKKNVTTPVIMVTSEKEASRVIEALDAGADNYVTNPFEPDKLSQKIKRVLQL